MAYPGTHLLGIVRHLLGGREEQDSCCFIELDLLVGLLDATRDLISANVQTWSHQGALAHTEIMRLGRAGDSPDGVKQNVDEESVALCRDVPFGQKHFVVAPFHQVLKHKCNLNLLSVPEPSVFIQKRIISTSTA